MGRQACSRIAAPIIVRSPDEWQRTLVYLPHLQRVQEPGEDGTILWEKYVSDP